MIYRGQGFLSRHQFVSLSQSVCRRSSLLTVRGGGGGRRVGGGAKSYDGKKAWTSVTLCSYPFPPLTGQIQRRGKVGRIRLLEIYLTSGCGAFHRNSSRLQNLHNWDLQCLIFGNQTKIDRQWQKIIFTFELNFS
jgi:hypothetical protein